MTKPENIGEIVRNLSLARVGVSINLVNSYTFTNLRRNRDYRNALLGKCFNFVDGKPLSLYLALRENKPRLNSRGMEILNATLVAQEKGKISNVFVFFERSDVTRMQHYVQQYIESDNIIIVPISDNLELNTIFQTVNQVVQNIHPKIVWIMLGSPRQEIVSSMISTSLSCPVIGIGGVIDFITGKVPEAPRIMQLLYLEWLYRLRREPVRLFKRYTFGNLIFLKAICEDFYLNLKYKRNFPETMNEKGIHFLVRRNQLKRI